MSSEGFDRFRVDFGEDFSATAFSAWWYASSASSELLRMSDGLDESLGGIGAPSGTSMSSLEVFGCSLSVLVIAEKYFGDRSEADPLNVSLFAIPLFTRGS